MGLAVIAVEVVNSSLLGIYFKVLARQEERRVGVVLQTKLNLALINNYIEWSIRLATIVVSLF